MMNSAAEIWNRVLSLMEGPLTSTTLNTWFDDTEALSLTPDRLTLYTPSDFKRDIITSRYLPNIQQALRELFSADIEVTVLGQGEKPQGDPHRGDFLPGTEEYTFDTFVVGSSNKFAYSAAQAVADAPGKPKGYNPPSMPGSPITVSSTSKATPLPMNSSPPFGRAKIRNFGKNTALPTSF